MFGEKQFGSFQMTQKAYIPKQCLNRKFMKINISTGGSGKKEGSEASNDLIQVFVDNSRFVLRTISGNFHESSRNI